MKKTLFFIMLTITLACSNKPSLQKYMVENSEKKEFIAIDISSDFLNIPQEKLSAEEKEALKSFKKINILAFKKDGKNENIYQSEKNKLIEVMKDTTQYQEIIKMGNNNENATLYTLGNSEKIDEFILIGNKSDFGFGVIRILGNNMDPNHALTLIGLIQKSNVNSAQFKPFEELLKN
jgi:hypothetical protein